MAKSLSPLLDQAYQVVDFLVEFGILAAQLLDFPHAVQNGSVVFSTELFTDFGQARLGHLFAEVHGDLPGKSDFGGVVLGLELGELDLELVADSFWIFSTEMTEIMESRRLLSASLRSRGPPFRL